MGVEDAELGYPLEHFISRRVSLDWTGKIVIAPSSYWGLDITVLTSGHDVLDRTMITQRTVQVDARATIGTRAFLYNCHVGEGAIVAAGTVLRSRDVPPWIMVEGNPARAIARFDHNRRKWVFYKRPRILPIKKGRHSE